MARTTGMLPASVERKRMLVLGCHDLEVARHVADCCVLVEQDHAVVGNRAIDKDEWDHWAEVVRLLLLPGGARDPVVVDWDGPRICSLALSRDGRRLAGGLSDGTVLLWDVRHLLGGNSSVR